MEIIRYLRMRGLLCKREVGKERFSREEGGGGGKRDATKCPAKYPVCIELLCRSGEVRGGEGSGRLLTVCGAPRPVARRGNNSLSVLLDRRPDGGDAFS